MNHRRPHEAIRTYVISLFGSILLTVGAVSWWIAHRSLTAVPEVKLARHATLRIPSDSTMTDITSVKFSPDGTTIALSRDDGECSLWDVAKGRRKLLLTKGAREVPGRGFLPPNTAFSPDGRLIATLAASGGGDVTIMDTSDGREVANLAGVPHLAHSLGLGGKDFRTLMPVSGLRFSPDGRTLTAVFRREDDPKSWPPVGIVRRWDASSWDELSNVRLPRPDALLRILSPDATTIALADHNNSPLVTLCDVTDGRIIAEFSTSAPPGSCALAFSPDGRTLAVGNMFGGTVELWDARLNAKIATLKPPASLLASVIALAFTPDGRSLVTCHGGSISPSPGGVSLSWLPFGLGRPFSFRSYPISHLSRVELAVWDVATGEMRYRTALDRRVHGLTIALAPDGRTLAMTAPEDRVEFWDVDAQPSR